MIKIASDMMASNYFKCLFQEIILGIGIILVVISLTLFHTRNLFEHDLNQVIGKDVGNMGLITIQFIPSNFSDDKMELFYDVLSDTEGIEAVSQCTTGGSYQEELIAMQKEILGNKDTFGYADDTYFAYWGQPGIFQMCNIELERGRNVTYSDIVHYSRMYDYWVPVYLGASYGDSLLGQKFIEVNEDGTEIIFEVLGILKKDTFIFDGETLMMGDLESEVRSVVCLDDYYLMIDNPNQRYTYFVINDDESFENVSNSIYSTADNIGISISIKNIGIELNITKSNIMKSANPIIQSMIYMIIVTGVCIICFQLNRLMTNQGQYGVLISLGISTKNLIYVELYEMMFKFLVSVVMSVFVLVFIAVFLLDIISYAKYEPDSFDLLRHVIFGYVVPQSLTLFSIILLCSEIPVITYLRKMNAVELIKEL